MKRLMLLVVILFISLGAQAGTRKMIPRYNRLTNSIASYPLMTIHDIHYVSPDSLHYADSIEAAGANPTNSHWTVQASPSQNDTVVVVAAVLAPYYTITYTQHGWTMLIRDTLHSEQQWSSLILRVGNTVQPCPDTVISCPDTNQAKIDGFTNVEKGDVIMVTGRIEEFPTGSMNSITQLRPIPGIPIEIISSGSYVFPPVPTVTADQFYNGAYVAAIPYHVKYQTGEPWEGSYVKMTNLTVTSIINAGRGQWNMADALGNQISDYDVSFWWTIGSSETPPIGDTTISHFHTPPIGAVIDSIKGIITVASGGENTRGYRIAPLFPDDVKYGVSKPDVFAHRRFPVAPKSTDSVAVQARAVKIAGGFDIGSVHLYFSTNGGPWVDHPMSLFADTALYQAYIIDPDGNPFAAGTQVRYFIKAFDVGTTSNILANSSSTVGNDTSQGFFFYTVLDRPLTIQDIQYTPYPNGRSGYLGGVVTVNGVVTADTSDVVVTPTGTFGTNAWYIQSGNAPWSGMWVVKKDSATGVALSNLHDGDSVAILGTVQEQFEVTRLLDSTVTVLATGRPIPAPVTLPTNNLSEQWESMLVKFTKTTLTDTGITFGDTYEYSVDDGSGVTIVRRDGRNYYSNIDGDSTLGRVLLHQEDPMDTIVGIAYYSHSRWKIIPRKNSDIVAGEPFNYQTNWNMVSIGRRQTPASTGYLKTTLYPGASSSAFAFTGTYVPTPTIEPRKGFWVKFPSARTIRQLGKKRLSDTVFVTAGWNLIGALGKPTLVSSITASPAGNHLGNFFEYNGAYVIQDSLLPAKGLWVKASVDGYFLENAASMNLPKAGPSASHIKQSFNTLTISDNAGHQQVLYFGEDTDGKLYLPDFELPPSAPEGSSFEVRYASGRVLEAYPKTFKSSLEYPVVVNVEHGPVTLSWNVTGLDGKRFVLGDLENGKTFKAREISGTGSALLGGSGELRLALKVTSGNVLPKEYALGQNYPNPFNPSTKMEVALPLTSHLELAVFNILGQKVATVTDEVREAGFHTLVWDGTTSSGVAAATGVYFMRMTASPVNTGSAQPFTAVRKVLLTK